MIYDSHSVAYVVPMRAGLLKKVNDGIFHHLRVLLVYLDATFSIQLQHEHKIQIHRMNIFIVVGISVMSTTVMYSHYMADL